MSLLNWLNPANLLGKVVDKVGEYQLKKKEKEILKVSAKHQIDLAKQNGDTAITLTDSQWEAIAMEKSDATWKDEYVTIVFTAPVVLVLAGAIWSAFTGNATLLNGTLSGVEQLKQLGISWDDLTYAIVLAAVGLKVWRGK